MAAGAGLDASSWPRAPGEELDDAYFLGMLEPDDLSAMWAKEGDIVVWTREYVRSQVGAPLLDVGLVKASQRRLEFPPAREAGPAPEQAPDATSTEPIARAAIRMHRCPECQSLNESAKFSRRSGGTTCQVCGMFDSLSPDAFSEKAASPPERRVPPAAEPAPGRPRPMVPLIHVPAGTAPLRAPLVAQVRLRASRPPPDENGDDETWRPAVDAVERSSRPGPCQAGRGLVRPARLDEAGTKMSKMKGIAVLLLICMAGMVAGLARYCRPPTSVQLWGFPGACAQRLSLSLAAPVPEGPLARWRTRLRSFFSRVKK
jgi:hypothetical protein